MNRYLTSALKADLNEKMVFLEGPRQVGKTTSIWRISRTASAGRFEALEALAKGTASPRGAR